MMKKIMCFVASLMFMLLSSCFSVFGESNRELLDMIISQKVLSGNATCELRVVPNSPLPGIIDPTGEITDMLKESAINYDMIYSTNEESTKLQAELDLSVDLPEKYMADIGIDSIKFWINMDFSNLDKPVYKIIFQNPLDDDYIHMDYIKILPADFVDSLANIANTSKYMNAALYKEMFDGIDLAQYLVVQNNKIKIVVNEKSVKEIAQSAINKIMDFTLNYSKSSELFKDIDEDVQNSATDKIKSIKGQINNFFETIAEIQIFDEDETIDVEMEFNEDKFINNQKTTINVHTNIFDIADAFGFSDPSMSGLSAYVDLSILMNISIGNINESVDIKFPEVTKDMFSHGLFGQGSRGNNYLYDNGEYESRQIEFVASSSDLLYFKKYGNANFLSPSGYAELISYSYDDGDLDFYSYFTVNDDSYEIKLLEVTSIYDEGFNGYFQIIQNGEIVEDSVFAKFYTYPLENDNRVVFKIYSEQEQWHLSGYISDQRLDSYPNNVSFATPAI